MPQPMKTIQFLVAFEHYNGGNPKEGIEGDIATFPAEKADRILALRMKGNAPVAKVVSDEQMRAFYEKEKARVDRDRTQLFDGPNLKERLRPNRFQAVHPALHKRFEAEGAQVQKGK
jgi:hypothetical protein